MVVNREGNCAAVGTVNVVALEDVAAWDCTINADNTNKTARIMATPDAGMITRYEIDVRIFDKPVDV